MLTNLRENKKLMLRLMELLKQCPRFVEAVKEHTEKLGLDSTHPDVLGAVMVVETYLQMSCGEVDDILVSLYFLNNENGN